MKPFISICIPTYKQPEHLRASLDAIRSQTYTDFEVIVTDDSPDDSVRDVVRRYEGYFTLKYDKNETPLGSPSNWNKALEEASGSYRLLLHHDDWLSSENSLLLIHEHIAKNPETDLLFLDYWNVSQKNDKKTMHSISEGDMNRLRRNPFFIFPGNLIGPPSVVVFSEKILVFYDPKLKWVVDIDQYISLLAKARLACHISAPVICVTNDSDFQVSRCCEENPEIEIFEWMYVGNKIWEKRKRYSWGQLYFFMLLFYKYRILDRKLLHKFGVEEIPWPFFFIIKAVRVVCLLKRRY